mgnify:FL=1
MTFSIHDLLFNLFSLLAIACAFTVVTTPNPIHSVLFLVGTFVNAGCLLVLFGAEYLGITFIIVYVGAITIVFLFVIMMLNIKQSELKESLRGRMARYLPIGGIISLVSLGLLLLTLSEDSPGFAGSFGSDELRYVTQECPYVNWVELADELTNLETLGCVLYTHYMFQLIVAGMLLLVSMILVIVLTGFRHEYIKHQDLYEQVSKDSDDCWTLWDGRDVAPAPNGVAKG